MDWTRQPSPDFQRYSGRNSGTGCVLEKGFKSELVPEDWCDSGLDSLIAVSLGGINDVTVQNDEKPWTSESYREDAEDQNQNQNQNQNQTCVSIGAGERLDSAIGDSITEDALGGLSDGIGTMVLGEQVADHQQQQNRSGSEKQRIRSEDLIGTLNFISEDGDTALHLALIHEQWDFVRCLIDLIAFNPPWTPYLDIQNELGQTPLHLAVIVDSSESVAALMEAGASAEHQERGGNTALHLAVREQRAECVRALTICSRYPASRHITITNYSGVSALHLAVQKGRRDIISMLLGAGADVNQRDQGAGRSALHWAVEVQCVELVALLLRAGALVDLRSYAGHTPLYSASCRPSAEIRELLRAAGASSMRDDEDEDDEEDEEEEEVERDTDEDEFDDVVINGQRVM